MHRRLESTQSVDLLEMLFGERRRRSDRPWVMLNMVVSIDGATAVGGGATGLNDADDRDMFLALRAVADVVLNGAETVRSENLGPISMSDEMVEFRKRVGKSHAPTMAIATRSLALDEGHRIFSDPRSRPMVITGRDADPERVGSLAEVADVVQVDELDGEGLIGAVGDVEVVLCEGGPTINSHLIDADVVDEVNLTISPVLALGESSRMAMGAPLQTPTKMALDRALIGEESLFLRFVRT